MKAHDRTIEFLRKPPRRGEYPIRELDIIPGLLKGYLYSAGSMVSGETELKMIYLR
jgi:hypothetical protein